MALKYINLDGSSFDGPLFHKDMEIATLDDSRAYRTLYNRTGEPLYRQELAVDENGHFIYPEETK